MTVGHSKELAKLIIELANNKKVNKEKLEKEIYNLALDVPNKFSLEIMNDFRTLKK